MKEMNIYELIRNWFGFCFENPEKINPNHSALYFFILEHANRMGWKQKIGLPSTMAKEAIGIKSYKTYIKTLNELVEFGFIEMLEKSKNQFSSNIVAIVNFTKAPTEALTKATLKHVPKQVQSTCQSNDSIIIPITNIPINQYTNNNNGEILKECLAEEGWCEVVCMQNKIPRDDLMDILLEFCVHLFLTDEIKTEKKEFKIHFTNWIKKQPVIQHPASATGTNQRQPDYDDD